MAPVRAFTPYVLQSYSEPKAESHENCGNLNCKHVNVTLRQLRVAPSPVVLVPASQPSPGSEPEPLQPPRQRSGSYSPGGAGGPWFPCVGEPKKQSYSVIP